MLRMCEGGGVSNVITYSGVSHCAAETHGKLITHEAMAVIHYSCTPVTRGCRRSSGHSTGSPSVEAISISHVLCTRPLQFTRLLKYSLGCRRMVLDSCNDKLKPDVCIIDYQHSTAAVESYSWSNTSL